jgi:hypothetical protein
MLVVAVAVRILAEQVALAALEVGVRAELVVAHQVALVL